MSQAPALRHVLGQIRLECGLSQKQLAEILGVAPITIQKIEQGILQLSEDLARKAQTQLDISAAWLLDNYASAPAVTPRHTTWTPAHYELAQAKQINPKIDSDDDSFDEMVAWRTAVISTQIQAMMVGSKGLPRLGILGYRLTRMLIELEKDFPPDPATLKSHQKRNAQLYAAFEAKLSELSRAEEEEIWGRAESEIRGRRANQAKPSSGPKTSK
jgi:transcriptional regulator with XRE-family HTH domain